ncbi:hypothetical protein BDP27DRAFT_1378150 [Rhodocollybia butyracea]|uniref:Uncharacterized protein n=1 Tax=Rhodocollybia butyracea TaxID=206335 RepID=A0A9P5P004_9AGAR|nr:hypothetical protein BDP27DRAFT_1378150 [Rhodocollybia butyracea]
MTKAKPLKFDAQDEKTLFPSVEGGLVAIDLRGGQGYLDALREFSRNPSASTKNVLRKNHLGVQISSKPPKRQSQLSKRRDALASSQSSDTLPGVQSRGVDLEAWLSGIDHLEYELCMTKGFTPGTYTKFHSSLGTRTESNFKTLGSTESVIQTSPGPSLITHSGSVNPPAPFNFSPISRPSRSFNTPVPPASPTPLFETIDSRSSSISVSPTSKRSAAISVFPNPQHKLSSPMLPLRLAGNQYLNISHMDLPALPARLASIWDDSLINWNPTYCPVVVLGVPVAAKYWPTIFKHFHQWSHAFRTLWLSWSYLMAELETFQYSLPRFWQVYSHCTKLREIHDILRKKRQEKEHLLYVQAQNDYSGNLSSAFSYRKGSKHFVCRTPKGVAKRLQKLQGES